MSWPLFEPNVRCATRHGPSFARLWYITKEQEAPRSAQSRFVEHMQLPNTWQSVRKSLVKNRLRLIIFTLAFFFKVLTQKFRIDIKTRCNTISVDKRTNCLDSGKYN